MPTSCLTNFTPNRAISLKNETCVYCGCRFEPGNITKEHVVGRKFVPTGLLNNSWNLIVQACKACNVRKSNLEDDISAITMQPDAYGRFATSDALLANEAARKAKNSRSRKSGETVANSGATEMLKLPLAVSAELAITMNGPPQIERARIDELSRLHISAFFYLITYNGSLKTGSYWPGEFFSVMSAPRSDWGNVINVAFMTSVKDWEPLFTRTTAAEYFKVVIRRHPCATTWSWALEWNKNYRVVGFFGERSPIENLVRSFPPLEKNFTMHGKSEWTSYRKEAQLSTHNDSLFHFVESN